MKNHAKIIKKMLSDNQIGVLMHKYATSIPFTRNIVYQSGTEKPEIKMEKS
jgi:hypothetical protein